jgi:predicted glycogen debranching enzyme
MSLYSTETYGELRPFLQREWLLTNGAGAFASGTVVGCPTRRYHALLCAATLPPLGRIVALNRVAEYLYLEGAQRPIELGVNQFREEFIPRGDRYLRRFDLDHTATWHYEAEGVGVRKEVLLCWQRNIVGIRYHVDPRGAGKVRLAIQPFASIRDFHALCRRHDGELDVKIVMPHQVRVQRHGHRLRMRCEQATFVSQPDWWYAHTYAIETQRGLDDTEDLFTPGRFEAEIDRPITLTLWAGLDLEETPEWEKELAKREQHLGVKPGPTPAQTRLLRASADFVVPRKSPDGSMGTTILAGYPWFSDWGRDTMISLPGLLLTTGRYHLAGQVLSVFAEYVSEGMVPNVFDDYTGEPAYNTVDASLWYVHAAHEYKRLSRDCDFFESHLLPACREIVDGYRRGTRYAIKMDEADGLIWAGDRTTQLTWMDAKCGDYVCTPRHGKAVEINALWHNALKLMGEDALAEKVADSFRRTFWVGPHRGLADVVNENGRDEAVRPNQIFAVSLRHSPLADEQQQAVVEVVRRELLTPFGLRTLAPADPKFIPRYGGDAFSRDKAYHNGAIWPWLIGPFLDAYLKVTRRSPAAVEQARTWLRPLIEHLEVSGCVGSISEIFEAESPHRPDGCFAQAWSIAEVLRLATELEM